MREAAITSYSLRHESAARLRHTMASEAYDEIAGALAEYRGHVEAALASLPSNAPALADLSREVDELMQWALQVMRAARTRHCDQLQQVSAALSYGYPAPERGTLKVDI
jgi:hypothetical protein